MNNCLTYCVLPSGRVGGINRGRNYSTDFCSVAIRKTADGQNQMAALPIEEYKPGVQTGELGDPVGRRRPASTITHLPLTKKKNDVSVVGFISCIHRARFRVPKKQENRSDSYLYGLEDISRRCPVVSGCAISMA